ncbi:MAG: Dabb family protein [Candidatus Bathyarchaeia archaeon]
MMISHVVAAKLKDRSPKNVESTRVLLESLRGKIPGLHHLDVGIDVGRSKLAYDIVLIAKFDDLDGLQVYREHPLHVPVVNKLMELAESVVVVDYRSD